MVVVLIVTYNSKDFIRLCLDSLERQTFRDFHTLIVDSGSTDGIRSVLAEYPRVWTIFNNNNLGFCKANNQGLAFILENNSRVRPEFVLFLNPDTILEPHTLERLVNTAAEQPKAGVFGPKVLRFHLERDNDDVQRPVATDVIDTAGIYPLKSFQFVSRGEGQIDEGQFPTGEIWGVSGTCVLVRSNVWELVKVKTREYLDEDLFMYKDDADLAFRLHRLGVVTCFVSSAILYHFRTASGALGDLKWWNFFNNLAVARRKKSSFTMFYGYRNQLLVLYKNLKAGEWLRGLPFIVWFEFRKFMYFSFTQPGLLLKAWKDVFRLRRKMKLKREIMNEVRF